MLDRLAKGMSVTLGLLGAGPESLAEPPSFSRMLFATATRNSILQSLLHVENPSPLLLNTGNQRRFSASKPPGEVDDQ